MADDLGSNVEPGRSMNVYEHVFFPAYCIAPVIVRQSIVDDALAAYRRELTLRPEAPHVRAGIVRLDPASVIVVDSDLPPAFSNQGISSAIASRIRVSNSDPDGALLVRLYIVVAEIGVGIEVANVLVGNRRFSLLKTAAVNWVGTSAER